MNLNFLKGLLIILVIVDHNEYSRSLFPGFLLGLTFHVVGFMTIPFLKAPAAPGTRAFGNYLFRLYYPFLLVACGLWLVVTLTEATPLPERLGMLALALYSGNADLLKATVHMGLLWFLPSFISVVVVRASMESARPAFKLAALAVLLAVHPFIGTFAKAVQDYLPMGLLPALYIIPLAYAGGCLHRSCFERLPAGAAILVSCALYVAIKAVQMSLGLDNEVGFASVADYTRPLALLVNDLEAVSGTLMLFQLARCSFQGIIEATGKYSMQMYLMHAFVALGIFKLLQALAPEAPPLLPFAGSVLATLLVTLGISVGVMRSAWLKRLIFPRDPAELAGRLQAGSVKQ